MSIYDDVKNKLDSILDDWDEQIKNGSIKIVNNCNHFTGRALENIFENKNILQRLFIDSFFINDIIDNKNFPEIDHECSFCGEQLKLTVTNNEINIHSNIQCHDKNAVTFFVDFPSGEVVAADWLDRLSEIHDCGLMCYDENNINKPGGSGQRTLFYAEHFNTVHIKVGNSSPIIAINDDKDMLKVGLYYDTIPNNYKRIAQIDTNLCWTTIMDKKQYDDLISKLSLERSEKYNDDDVVNKTFKIKPGRWQFKIIEEPFNAETDKELFFKASWFSDIVDKKIEPNRLMTFREALNYKAHELSHQFKIDKISENIIKRNIAAQLGYVLSNPYHGDIGNLLGIFGILGKNLNWFADYKFLNVEENANNYLPVMLQMTSPYDKHLHDEFKRCIEYMSNDWQQFILEVLENTKKSKLDTEPEFKTKLIDDAINYIQSVKNN